jgi:D-sedoheptulose 7-phosphate isomerase
MTRVYDERMPQRPVDVQRITAIWQEHLAVARELDRLVPQVAAAAAAIISAFDAGRRLFLAGNGGSASDAQHIAAELTGRFLRERRPLPAMALHVNGSALTAVGNDYGFDEVFARELQAHARSGDVLIALSTSGASPNILRAASVAREHGLFTIGLTGANGDALASVCDVGVKVPSSTAARIQEMHILIGHTICDLIDAALA